MSAQTEQPPASKPRPRPFLKWAGGKSQLLPALDDLSPDWDEVATYHEPFVGSGALFFHLRAQGHVTGPARLSDANAHLISTWAAVRESPREIAAALRELAKKHSEDAYYRIRERFNDCILGDVERAALLIYLNKAGFNGLYRVNKKGRFNVPMGKQASGPSFPTDEHLTACSSALQDAVIEHAGFESTLEHAQRGDFVYFDPPYVPLTATSSFTSYDSAGFGKDQQLALRDAFRELDRRGCQLMLSNSGTDEVRELYSGFDQTPVSARRSINSKGGSRGPVLELVIRNYL